MKHHEVHRFLKGEKYHLDTIYMIQGIGCAPELGGQWWEPDDEAGDNVTITRDITISITVTCHKPSRRNPPNPAAHSVPVKNK